MKDPTSDLFYLNDSFNDSVCWNVFQARQLVTNGREPNDWPLSYFNDWIHNVYVDIDHAIHMNLGEPIILAQYDSKVEDLEGQYVPIDGNHRIARAILEGETSIKAYLLSKQESDDMRCDD